MIHRHKLEAQPELKSIQFSWVQFPSPALLPNPMLFVVSDEIIPESRRKGFEREATFGLIIGFVVMMLLDSLFV
jgi:hypothetical protein